MTQPRADRPERALAPVDTDERTGTPYHEADVPVVQRTLLGPSNPADKPSRYRRFLNFLRRRVGLRSVELADRFAEATVADKEVDVEIRLIQAKAEYEKTMAEVHKIDAEAEERRAAAKLTRADADCRRADARAKAAKARQEQAKARITEHLDRLVRAKQRGPEAALEWVDEVISKIELQHEGRVEIQPATPPSDNDEGTKV